VRAFTVIDCDQRTPAWKSARAGRLTASRAKDMLASVKSGEAAARRDLRVQLVVERLTGEPQDATFVNADMQRGIDLEREAFAAYEIVTGHVAHRCGFVAHNELPIGCSPDGVIDDFRGLLELKVPKSATHLGYLRSGGVPAEHRPQLLHALWVTGAEYIDFLSFDPRFPASMETFYVRLERDEDAIAEYAKKALAFLVEIETELQAMRTATDMRCQWAGAVEETR
jgi:hypothetical protein